MWTMVVLNGVQKHKKGHKENYLWCTGTSSSSRVQHRVVKLNLEQSVWCLGMEISFQGILGMRLHAGLC